MASDPNQTSGQTHVFITKNKNQNQKQSKRNRRAWQSLPEGGREAAAESCDGCCSSAVRRPWRRIASQRRRALQRYGAAKAPVPCPQPGVAASRPSIGEMLTARVGALRWFSYFWQPTCISHACRRALMPLLGGHSKLTCIVRWEQRIIHPAGCLAQPFGF